MSYPTADAAAAAFYRAFANGDAAAMDALWLEDDTACCVHPARDPLLGHAAVTDSWRQILAEADGFDISFQPGVRLADGDLVVDIGMERLTTETGQVALLTVTNAFQRTPAGWQMVLHHAAPVQHPGTPAGTAIH